MEGDILLYLGSEDLPYYGYNNLPKYGEIVIALTVDDDGTFTAEGCKDDDGFYYWFASEDFELVDSNNVFEEDVFTGEEISFF